jgi:small-conductance mechanosensitive channel
VALFTAFGASSLDFELRVWTGEFENWRRVSSEVAIAVNEALKRAGIQIPFPQRDLHLRSMDPPVERAMRGAAPESAA